MLFTATQIQALIPNLHSSHKVFRAEGEVAAMAAICCGQCVTFDPSRTCVKGNTITLHYRKIDHRTWTSTYGRAVYHRINKTIRLIPDRYPGKPEAYTS
jgi:hypothetical protein